MSQDSIPDTKPIAFGDNVRILAVPETSRRGLAGRVGQVFGHTTPSSTGVEVIGSTDDDFALNVFIKELDEAFWFTRDLVEFIDHAAGTEASLDGVPGTWVRTEHGEWAERPKPWWRFWK